jgi:transcriptional regulator with XRE-family HTH domain
VVPKNKDMTSESDHLKQMAQRIKALRADAGYTRQEDIASALGIERNAYAHYETGRSPLPFHLMPKFCKLTKTTLDFLITGSESELAIAYKRLKGSKKLAVDEFLGFESEDEKSAAKKNGRA